MLPPDLATLGLLEPLLSIPGYFEVTPETTWRLDGRARLVENGFHTLFREIGRAAERPFVAHGVGLSMGSTSPSDAPRVKRWLSRLRKDQALFRYLWFTDHAGLTMAAGQSLTLPLPLPMTSASVAATRRRLASMQRIVPDVGVETTAHYFLFGPPLEEPAFYGRVVAGARRWLLLDLHNVHTMSVNMGFDAWDYVSRLPLDKVIEIHVSGGVSSDGSWLRSGRSLRLDSHDDDVPDDVWRLLERVLPICPNLRGVTLERMEGTVEATTIPRLRRELRRIEKTIQRKSP